MHPALQQFFCNLIYIGNLRHGHHGITTQVRVYKDRLRIGITNHTDALIARKGVELVFELRTEIVTLQVMNLTTEAFLVIIGHQTCSTRTKV